MSQTGVVRDKHPTTISASGAPEPSEARAVTRISSAMPRAAAP